MIRNDHKQRRGATWLRSNHAGVPLMWAGGGFIAGAVFWHLVGFWTLVSVAVLGGNGEPDGRPGRTTVASPAKQPVRPLETGSVSVRRPACVALSLDRLMGETRSLPCPADTFHLVNGGLGTKEDLAPGAAAWSTTLR